MTPEEYKATRSRLGTQAEAAAMLGVNRVTVAKRENGTMTITNEAVLAIQSLRGREVNASQRTPLVRRRRAARDKLGDLLERADEALDGFGLGSQGSPLRVEICSALTNYRRSKQLRTAFLSSFT